MIVSMIDALIRRRVWVWLIVFAAIPLSFYAIREVSLDAIPDISDPQIVIYAKWPRSPQLLESEVTSPLIDALIGAPGVSSLRATSHMGFAFVYVILNDAAVRDRVRQTVQDRVNTVRAQLPSDAEITIGPNASSVGWIYQYALVDKQGIRDLREMRLLNENLVKLSLQRVPGVAEVASVGGLEKQYQLKVYAPLLADKGITLSQLVASVRQSYQEAGGRMIEVTNRDYQMRATVDNEDIGQLDHLIIGRTKDGHAVQLKEVGYVTSGYDQRRSAVDLDGTGEVVGGIVVMEQNQNVLAVVQSLGQRLRDLKASLPEGIEIVTAYDRSEWIWSALREFIRTLGIEIAVLIAITLLFLRNLRTSAGPVAILLLSTLFTFIPLLASGQTINLFSLAGLCIAIGEIADATIVLVENCAAELAHHPHASASERRSILIGSMAKVAKPLIFSLLIILVSFLPVFFFEPREARLFDPLAYSKSFAMGFSTVLTLALLPIIALWIFKPQAKEARDFRESAAVRMYRSILQAAIRRRYAVTLAGLAVLIPAAFLLNGFPRDFMPDTDEGSILYMPSTLPGLPNREAGWVLQQMDRKLKAFPEVERVFGKMGRADTSTDPAPLTMIETTVLLKPSNKWREGMTKDRLVAEMDQALQTIGYVNTWVQPIRARFMMQSTGLQTPVGIKVKGPDLATVEKLSVEIEEALRSFPGTKSVLAERISDGYYMDVRHDLARLAEHGVTVDEAMTTVRYGVGGDNIAFVPQSDGGRIPLNVQYSPEYLDTVEKVRNVPVVTGDGRSVPLRDVAQVAVQKMPEMIRNDDGELAAYVYVDLQSGVTGPDYVDSARAFLQKRLELPTGYFVEWTGLYEYTTAAKARQRIVVPLTLVLIFGLLVIAFRSVSESVVIMLSVPFAMVGGVFLQWVLGYPLTTAVIVGYVSLFAVAVQTGIIMIIFIREAIDKRTSEQSFESAVLDGSVARLRPKMMTVAAIVLSLMPVLLSHGSGIEILKPIAAPSIGGMLSSTIHVLFMTPCLVMIGEDLRHSAWWSKLRGLRGRGR